MNQGVVQLAVFYLNAKFVICVIQIAESLVLKCQFVAHLDSDLVPHNCQCDREWDDQQPCKPHVAFEVTKYPLPLIDFFLNRLIFFLGFTVGIQVPDQTEDLLENKRQSCGHLGGY